MTSLEVLMDVAGILVTVLVVAEMILITPRGQVDVHGEATDPRGADRVGQERRRTGSSTFRRLTSASVVLGAPPGTTAPRLAGERSSKEERDGRSPHRSA